MQEITLKASIPSLIHKRNLALKQFEEAFELLSTAIKNTEEACIGSKQNYTKGKILDEIKSQIKYSNIDYNKEEMRIVIDRAMWRSFVVNTPLWSLMDTTARKNFDKDMEGVPPEATEENLFATMQTYFADADNIFRRSLIETFCNLSNEYKSNNVFKLDKKIILGHIQNKYGSFNYYAEDRIRDLDRVFWVLDGKEYPTNYNSGLVSKLKNALSEASAGTFSAGSGNVETEYFHVKFFKNGNAHAIFKREDLVLKANKIIAEHYGEVLPDQNNNKKNRREKEYYKEYSDHNYYPTPKEAITVMLYEANIEENMTLLEPSAGNGAIVNEIKTMFPSISICSYEIDEERAKNSNSICFDFMKVDTEIKYDRIVMNPPFSEGRWYKHVIHAFNMLLPGGRLVAIIPFGGAIEKDYETEWKEIYKNNFVNEIELKAGTFKHEGTMIKTKIIVLEK